MCPCFGKDACFHSECHDGPSSPHAEEFWLKHGREMGCGGAPTAPRFPKGCWFPGPERSWTEAAIPAQWYSTSGGLLAPTVLVHGYALAALLADAAVALEQVSFLPRQGGLVLYCWASELVFALCTCLRSFLFPLHQPLR